MITRHVHWHASGCAMIGTAEPPAMYLPEAGGTPRWVCCDHPAKTESTEVLGGDLGWRPGRIVDRICFPEHVEDPTLR